jgi:N-glycosidase YbiA
MADLQVGSMALPLMRIALERGEEEDVWAWDDESFPFEDEEGRFYLTVQHFFQASKFFMTDPSYAELVIQATSAEEAIAMARNPECPPLEEWNECDQSMIRRALWLKISQNPELQHKLLSTGSSPLAVASANSYWGVSDGTGDNHYGKLLMAIRSRLSKNTRLNERKEEKRVPKPRGRAKEKRGKRNLFQHADGTPTFDMVSSSLVRVTVGDGSIIVPMSALPGEAKTITHKYQFFKKRNPECHIDLGEEDLDDYVDDTELREQYIFERATILEPTTSLEDQFADQMTQLLEFGCENSDANFAALLSCEGDIYSALELLVS